MPQERVHNSLCPIVILSRKRHKDRIDTRCLGYRYKIRYGDGNVRKGRVSAARAAGASILQRVYV